MSILQKQLADESNDNDNNDNNDNNNTKSKWNTSAITPGTEFMKQLGFSINKRFSNNAKEFGLEKIKISNADEEGEGEHKIFEYIRQNDLYHKNTKTIIYDNQGSSIAFVIFDGYTSYLKKSGENFRFFSPSICRGDRVQVTNGMSSIIAIEAIRK